MSEFKFSDQAKNILSSLDDSERVIISKYNNSPILGDEEFVKDKFGVNATSVQQDIDMLANEYDSIIGKSQNLKSEVEKKLCLYRAKYLKARSLALCPIFNNGEHKKYFFHSKVLYNEVLELIEFQEKTNEENARKTIRKLSNADTFHDALSGFGGLNDDDPFYLWDEYIKDKDFFPATKGGVLYFLSFVDENPSHYERIIEFYGIDHKIGIWAAKQLETLKNKESKKSSQSGCFIATAAYNSENSEDVLTLKNYRDEVLSKLLIGRFFIKFYYLISPKIAKAISKEEKIKHLVKCFLIKPFIKFIVKK